MARNQLKVLNLNTDCIYLTLDTATINRNVKTNTLNMHDLSRFHHLTGLSKNGLGFSDCAIYKKIFLGMTFLLVHLCICCI